MPAGWTCWTSVTKRVCSPAAQSNVEERWPPCPRQQLPHGTHITIRGPGDGCPRTQRQGAGTHRCRTHLPAGAACRPATQPHRVGEHAAGARHRQRARQVFVEARKQFGASSPSSPAPRRKASEAGGGGQRIGKAADTSGRQQRGGPQPRRRLPSAPLSSSSAATLPSRRNRAPLRRSPKLSQAPIPSVRPQPWPCVSPSQASWPRARLSAPSKQIYLLHRLLC